jgi:LAO/AO transport system kinase
MSQNVGIPDPAELAGRIRSGDRRTLARALTLVENEAQGHEAFLDEIYPDAGRAWRIGLTGPPGAGKSTLAGRLIDEFVADGRRVAYLGIDPSSPFSGGAVLGDRIRLSADHGEQVFVRSAASRGAQGGLSGQTDAIADVLDAAGFDILLIESVGVGQAELDIALVVDTVVVVMVPESGDEVQAMKAGLLEIGDVVCVNKADRSAADALYAALKHAVAMRTDHRRKPDVARSIATEPGGVAQLLESIRGHLQYLEQSGRWKELRNERLRRRIEDVVRSEWDKKFWTDARTGLLRAALDSLDKAARRPYSLASRIIDTEPSE